MKKRLLILVFAGLMSLVLLPEANASAGYSDVPEEHWAAESIQRATELGYFQGVDEGRFGLGQPISRAAFSSALVRMFGWEEVRPAKSSFDDVDKTRWFYTAAETTLANGAVAAAGQDFRPDDDLTRGEMASMLVRGLGYSTLAGQMTNAVLPFTDVTSNRGYIAMAYDFGIVDGYDDSTFRPRAVATREEAAVMLMRVYRKLHAASTAVTADSGFIPISISTPRATVTTSIPTTPLESVESLYNILRRYHEAGTDMSKVAVILTAGGVATTTEGSKIVSSETISASAVSTYLASSGVRTYYSDQHQCAYLILSDKDTTLTIWYQTPESQAAKLQLCRLFGVEHYILQDV